MALLLPLAVSAVLGLFRDIVANTNAALMLVLIIVAAASRPRRPYRAVCMPWC